MTMPMLTAPVRPFYVVEQKHCGHLVARFAERPDAVALKSDLHLEGLHAFRVRRGVESERRAPMFGDASCDSCAVGRKLATEAGAR